MLPSPWRTATFPASVSTSFLGIAFSVHGTPLFSLSLRSFLCSSSTLGCLGRGSCRCISLYQIQLILTACDVRYHIAL